MVLYFHMNTDFILAACKGDTLQHTTKQ